LSAHCQLDSFIALCPELACHGCHLLCSHRHPRVGLPHPSDEAVLRDARVGATPRPESRPQSVETRKRIQSTANWQRCFSLAGFEGSSRKHHLLRVNTMRLRWTLRYPTSLDGRAGSRKGEETELSRTRSTRSALSQPLGWRFRSKQASKLEPSLLGVGHRSGPPRTRCFPSRDRDREVLSVDTVQGRQRKKERERRIKTPREKRGKRETKTRGKRKKERKRARDGRSPLNSRAAALADREKFN
jgi:hypothetical protein